MKRASRLSLLLARVGACAFLCLLATLATPSPARAQQSIGIGVPLGLSPYWNWKTIESEHFRVTFPVDLYDPAQKLTGYLEEAHRVMSPYLYWEPHYKAQVLVIDNQDEANGATQAVARIGMILYAVPPDSWGSTAYYDNWLRLLAFHEYTHFLNMDATRDFWQMLRYVFGDVDLPNALWPTWMLEGLAVWDETRYTHAGRGRSPYYEMILRAGVEDGTLNTGNGVTIDRMNGTNPWFPGGETYYLYGFELMNRIAHDPIGPQTYDRDDEVRDGQDALGLMSKRSSRRVPYFINGNLENITGKDWYDFWDELMAETRKVMTAQLAKIRAQPVTPVERLTTTGFETTGPRVSPDGRWLAYTQDSVDFWMGLYLMDLKTGESHRITDKLGGAQLTWTPDSKYLVYSALRQTSEYNLYSDLAAYSLDDDSWEWITDGLRARDPDISRDGQSLTFTLTEAGETSLAIAPLYLKNMHPVFAKDVGLPGQQFEKVWSGGEFDRVATPRFSTDGKSVYFSFHRNGETGEELMRFDRAAQGDAKKATVLVADGAMNRFPAIGPAGEVYYVSDATGVDNVWRLGSSVGAGGPALPKAALVSNLTTGVNFPDVTAYGTYGAVFTSSGWDVGKLTLASAPIDPAAVCVQGNRMITPKSDQNSQPPPPASPDAPPKKYPISDYSLWPSILPREWAPLAVIFPKGAYLGGEVLGFDAVDRHEYTLVGAYDTQVKAGDLYADYANRQLGPTFDFSYDLSTTALDLDDEGNLINYTRRTRFTATGSYTFRWTYSSLTPDIALAAERSTYFQPTFSDANSFYAWGRSPYVPTVDLGLFYTSVEASPLAITPEAGRSTFLGSRVYLDSGEETWKQLFTDSEYWRLIGHSVLVPSVRASWVSHYHGDYLPADVLVQGRYDRLVSSLPADNFTTLALRGYPNRPYYARAAAVGSLDYRFPLAYVYRGWGTNPVFLDNLFGFVYAESGYFPLSEPGTQFLPSAGGGVQLNTELLLQIPLVLALEYDDGFATNYGGAGQLSFELGLGAIQF